MCEERREQAGEGTRFTDERESRLGGAINGRQESLIWVSLGGMGEIREEVGDVVQRFYTSTDSSSRHANVNAFRSPGGSHSC